MPKIFGKDVPPIIIGGMGLVAVVLAYNAAFPTSTPRAASSSKPLTKKNSGQPAIFTKDDYSIHFASLTQPVKNTFQPLVIRKNGNSSNPGSAPLTFVGEAGWIFTGTAQVNGVVQGLLENTKTGDSEFVTKGQHWKLSTIGDITPDSLTLYGAGGSLYVMQIGSSSEPAPGSDVNANSSVAPVNVPPGMVGPIGPNDINVQPAPGNGGGGGRRRRNWGMNQYNLGNEE
jgi:hypothetical protein